MDEGRQGEEMGVAAQVPPLCGPTGGAPDGSPAKPAAANAGSVPNAGQWAVVNSSGDFYSAVQIAQVTPKLIKIAAWRGKFHQYPRECIAALFDSRELAERMVQALDGVRGSFRNARFNENKRHKEAVQRIADKQEAAIERVISRVRAAQAMSAGTAETAQQAQGVARQRGPKDAPGKADHAPK